MDNLESENRDKVIKIAIAIGRNKSATIKQEILKRSQKKKQKKEHLVRVLRTFWLGKLVDADYAVFGVKKIPIRYSLMIPHLIY